MKKHFDVLDAFRGIAALMVAIYHLHVMGIITELNFVRNSYLFVEFFFVLSGFVISYSCIDKNISINWFFVFMKKRFARIYPLHIFMTLMFIPFAIINYKLNIDLGDRFSLESFIRNLFLTQALWGSGETWNLPAWSISVEFYTYIIFGLSILVVPVKKSIIFPLIICGISLLLYLTFGTAILRCLYSFYLGVIAFKVSAKVKVKPWMEFVSIGFLILLLSLFRAKGGDIFSFLLPFLFFAIVIVFSHESGGISNILKRPYFKMMGTLSFSIYLIHAWFISSIKGFNSITVKLFNYEFMHTINGDRVLDFGFGTFNDLIYIPFIGVVIGVSYLTFKFIEKPWQKKINKVYIEQPSQKRANYLP